MPNLLVYITVPDEQDARRLADGLIENSLAAGVNLAGPVYSCYGWQGKVCRAAEWQLFVQTHERELQDLIQFVTAHHPHLVPCIIAMPIVGGYAPFLQWINANSGGKV